MRFCLSLLPPHGMAVEVGEPLKLEVCTAVEIRDEAQQRVQELVNRARQRLPVESG